MLTLMHAIAALRPGVNCANPSNGTSVAAVRWDAPLPEGFEPPTQEAVEAEMARLEAAADRIAVERLYFMLEVEEEPGLATAIEVLLDQMAEAGNRKPRIYWRDAKVFESDHPLMLQLGQHPSIGKDAAAIRRMCEVAYAKQLAGAA